MALPSSGALALSDFNTELGNSAGTQINLDASAVRALIGKSSGAVASFSDYYGASAGIGQVASGNATYANIQYVGVIQEVMNVRSGFSNRNGYATGTPFTLNNRTTEFLRLTFFSGGQGTPSWQFELVDSPASNVPTGHPANSGWTTVTLSGNGYTYSFNRASAQSYVNNSVLYGLGGGSATLCSRGSWTWGVNDHSNGSTNPFPNTNNTTSFTVSMS